MKKRIILIIIVGLLLLMLPLMAGAETILSQDNNWRYEVLTNSACKLLSYAGSESEIALPTTIDNYVVISMSTVYDFFANSSPLYCVRFPYNLSYMNTSWAMGGSDHGSTKNIGDYQLQVWIRHRPNAESEEHVYYQDIVLVSYLGHEDNVIVPSTINGIRVTGLSDETFLANESLCSVFLPSTITYIPHRCFAYCTNLTTISINNINTIGNSAFAGCTNLSMTIPEKVMIFKDAFYQCKFIKAPCSILKSEAKYNEIQKANDYQIEHNIFVDNKVEPTYTETGLTEGTHCSVCNRIIDEQKRIPAIKDMSVLQLPSSLTTIEEEAFANLACQAIIIPDGCTTICEHAFANCLNLIYVHIPASVTSIANNAFEGCNKDIAVFRATE